MDEGRSLIQRPVSGWTEAEILTLVREHGILLRTLGRLQEQVGRLLNEAAAQAGATSASTSATLNSQ